MTTHEYHSQYYDEMQKEPVTDDFVLPAATEMTPELLRSLIDEHTETRVPRYMRLKAAYEGKFLVFGRPRKPAHKPDNRLAANMCKYLCDTFNGYFIGIPATVRHESEKVSDWIAEHSAEVDQDDVNAELAEEASKYGHAFELLYQNAEGRPGSAVLTPITTFTVKDDTVEHRPLFGVRYSYDEDGMLQGSWYTDSYVTPFSEGGGGIEFGSPDPHSFGEVPIIEYLENKEKIGVYEGVLNLVEAYSKALSEKANDVDYFADAYLAVTNGEIDEKDLEMLKENRVINVVNDDGKIVTIEFLAKPDADGAQENLINRLEMLIFKLSMVPDISDESFGTASGIALKMRLLPMSNLAKKKERKFAKAMRRRYRLLGNYPNTPLSEDDWRGVEITMRRNMPEDLASEAELAGSLSGIVSEETQLSVLSFVDDPKAEIARKEDELNRKAESAAGGFPTNRTQNTKEEQTDDRNLQRREEQTA